MARRRWEVVFMPHTQHSRRCFHYLSHHISDETEFHCSSSAEMCTCCIPGLVERNICIVFPEGGIVECDSYRSRGPLAGAVGDTRSRPKHITPLTVQRASRTASCTKKTEYYFRVLMFISANYLSYWKTSIFFFHYHGFISIFLSLAKYDFRIFSCL